MDKGLEMGSWASLIVKIGIVLCERDYYRSQTSPRRAHPLGLPLSAGLGSVLSNILLLARLLMVCRVLHALM
jgi:hypothetical protein